MCTSGSWPSFGITQDLPSEIRNICEIFTSYFQNKRAGTKLAWQLNSGDAELIVQFNPNTERLITVSTFQMIILLLFNHPKKKVWKFSEIEETTHISKAYLEAHILCLAHPSKQVLLKKPNVKEVKPDDEFKLNTKFSSKTYRVEVGSPSKISDEKESEDKLSRMVSIQRQHQYAILNFFFFSL